MYGQPSLFKNHPKIPALWALLAIYQPIPPLFGVGVMEDLQLNHYFLIRPLVFCDFKGEGQFI